VADRSNGWYVHDFHHISITHWYSQALARALYARRDLVVLDDILSALDARTEKLVVDRLFEKNGLFRTLKSTVILATHSG
jgi:ABC-type transport system involved in cytochrome bd biosynthesis fused ATPase/permease subunit